MGLFDKLNGKKNKEAEKQPETPAEIVKEVPDDDDKAEGWDAIEKECERVYPGQTSPKHYGTIIPYMLGGKDPLDGISVYDGGDFWHFVTFGMTELYEKECENKEVSGWGYEMTFRLKKEGLEDEEMEIRSVCGVLQQLARITYNNSEVFDPFEYVYTGQTEGIDANRKSNLTGFICVPDPSFQTIDTPHGKVAFIEFIGMTDAELKTLGTHDSVREIYAKLGSDLTDYHRESIV